MNLPGLEGIGSYFMVWQDVHIFPGQHFPGPGCYALGKRIWILALYRNRAYHIWSRCCEPYTALDVPNTSFFIQSSVTPDDGHSLACLD